MLGETGKIQPSVRPLAYDPGIYQTKRLQFLEIAIYQIQCRDIYGRLPRRLVRTREGYKQASPDKSDCFHNQRPLDPVLVPLLGLT